MSDLRIAVTSAPVPSSRTWPLSTTTARVASDRPARTFCSTSRIVRPSSHMVRTCWRTFLRVFGSRPMDGSSRTTSFGSSIRHRANSTRRCWPPDRPRPCRRPGPRQSGRGPRSSEPSGHFGLVAERKPPISTFSRTVISGNRLWFWGTCTMPSARICAWIQADDRAPAGSVTVALARREPAAHRHAEAWTCRRHSARRRR